MDKGSSLQKLYAIFEELGKKIETYISRYQFAETNKLIEINCKEQNNDEHYSIEEINQNQKTIQMIDNELAEIIKQVSDSAPNYFPPTYGTSLKIMLNEQKSTSPIIKINDELIYYYVRHFENEENNYSPVVNKLNRLNEIRQNIKRIIKTIEEIPKADEEYISKIEYNPKTYTLTINNRNITFERGERYDLLARAFFANPDFTLLTEEVCDGDIYELAEKDGLLMEKSKEEKRQYILDGYRLMNKEIRDIVPGGKNLVKRVHRHGFILNPELKQK